MLLHTYRNHKNAATQERIRLKPESIIYQRSSVVVFRYVRLRLKKDFGFNYWAIFVEKRESFFVIFATK